MSLAQDLESGDGERFDAAGWKAALVADLDREVRARPWGRALMAVGWVHLVSFLICHAFYVTGDTVGHFAYVMCWFLEFVVVLAIFRKVIGRGWVRATPLIGIFSRVWITFLILSFNLAAMNNLTGFSFNWFKPVWTTLSTFGFAVMAYLTSAWFFVPAVWMYFTGLLMVAFPIQDYLIYGLSWWIVLQSLGGWLEWRRRRASSARSVAEGESGARTPRPHVEHAMVGSVAVPEDPGAVLVKMGEQDTGGGPSQVRQVGHSPA